MYKQVELKKENTFMITWIECSKDFKINDFISFKDQPNVFRKVINIFEPVMERTDIKREWNAGGLDKRNRIT